MKAKLLSIVRKKVSLQERNGQYYVYNKGLMVCTSNYLGVCEDVYRNVIIELSREIFRPKCKKRLL